MEHSEPIIGKIVCYLGSGFFVLYGLGFALWPLEFARFITDAEPGSPSAIIDMRATYGGMSLAAGLILAMLAAKADTLQLSLISLFVLMLGMASGRLVGIFVDGDPNIIMYVYLALEIFVAVICALCLKVQRKNTT